MEWKRDDEWWKGQTKKDEEELMNGQKEVQVAAMTKKEKQDEGVDKS